jgi:hypothetical protein
VALFIANSSPNGQTINKEFYCEVLLHLRENVWQKRLDLWGAKNWILHNNNAPCHQSQHVISSTLSLLSRFSSCQLLPFPEDAAERLPFSHCCRDPAQITKGYGLTQNDFEATFQQWQECCDRCSAVQGDYFEGDGVQT